MLPNRTRWILALGCIAAALAYSQPLPLEGIAHVGFRVSDLDKARAYYSGLLGYQEAFHLTNDAGQTTVAYFKVSEDQYLESSPNLQPDDNIRFTHVAFETTDIEALRRLLAARGLDAPPAAKGRDGNLAFSLRDPDNQRIEFVQYLAGSLHRNARGKFLDDRRLSDHLQHTGVTVPKDKLQAALHFYRDQLGFQEFWRRPDAPAEPELVKLLVPGKRRDIVELMMYGDTPTRTAYGVMHHINLDVPETTPPYLRLLERGMPPARGRPKVNAENIWAIDVYDPDGTRTEIQDLRKVPNLPIAVVGLTHGHVGGFFSGFGKRFDAHVVGIAEPDEKLWGGYASRYKLDSKLFFTRLEEMLDKAKPRAVVVFTDTYDHLRVVEACAARGIHVMMEKPLSASLEQARAMERAAQRGRIHVLVNYETSWYASNYAAWQLAGEQQKLGPIRKMVAHDGHQGPKEIGVQPEFLSWLTDPVKNGAGALFDFGCYGADLMTWLMKGERPRTVTAVALHIKPDVYPKVDDDATVILDYGHAQGIVQASWNWPFSRKDLEVYGQSGYVITVGADQIRRRVGSTVEEQITAQPLAPRHDTALSYLTAVVRGEVTPDDLSSLSTNIVVMEILEAAKRSAATGQTVRLPPNNR